MSHEIHGPALLLCLSWSCLLILDPNNSSSHASFLFGMPEIDGLGPLVWSLWWFVFRHLMQGNPSDVAFPLPMATCRCARIRALRGRQSYSSNIWNDPTLLSVRSGVGTQIRSAIITLFIPLPDCGHFFGTEPTRLIDPQPKSSLLLAIAVPSSPQSQSWNARVIEYFLSPHELLWIARFGPRARHEPKEYLERLIAVEEASS
jgi:hypothetical protein